MATSTTWTTALVLGRRNRLAAIGMCLVALFVVLALLSPWIAPHDPYDLRQLSLLDSHNPPAWLEVFETGLQDPLSAYTRARDALPPQPAADDLRQRSSRSFALVAAHQADPNP